MFLDEVAAEMTLNDIEGLTMDDLVRASRIMETYKRNLQKAKSNKDLNCKRVVYQKNLENEKRKHPNQCFCEEDGFDVLRLWERDGIIRYVTSYSHFDFMHQNPSQEPIYRCSRCGKEYRQQIGFA